MAKKEDLEAIGGLSAPSKMPAYSWSIPASTCILGSKLRGKAGTTCTDCYAFKGKYNFPSVQRAMARRYDILKGAMAETGKGRLFVQSFANVLNDNLKGYRGGKRDARYFRWHDSGDLQGPMHLDLINEIARATPKVTHWLPTREDKMVRNWMQFNIPVRNLRVRLSAQRVNQAPTRLLDLHEAAANISFSGVHTQGAMPEEYLECPAHLQGGECQSCRTCWNNSVPVSYLKH